MSGAAFFLLVWNYNYFDNFMVTRLFKLEKVDADKLEIKSLFARSSFMNTQILDNPKEYFCELVPSCLKCAKWCRPGRRQRGF